MKWWKLNKGGSPFFGGFMIVYIYEDGSSGFVTDAKTREWVCKNGFESFQDLSFIYVGF